MEIELLPAQLRFVTTKSPYPAIVGGLGSGKTQAGTYRLILKMLQEPGINTLYGMPTYDLLRLRAMPGVEDDLQKIGVEYTLNKSEYSITIHGYGVMYFRSYDRPERWVAFHVAHCLLDELDTLPLDKAALVWRKASERTRQHTQAGNTIANVTTPDMGVNGFTFQKWVKQAQPGYELIKASTLDNFYLPDSYVEQIRANYDPLLADLYLHGEFVSLSQNKVYHFFNRNQHHTSRSIKPDDQFIHVGVDFNVGGTCAVVFLIENNAVYAVDEFVSHDTYDFVNNLHKRYKDKTIVVYPDATGKKNTTNATASDLAIIRQDYRVDAGESNPFVRDRINAMNAMIAHDRYFVNTDKCQNHTFALESQGYTNKGEPEKFDDHPAIDDWNDAAGYFVARKFPIKKPVHSINMRFPT